VFDVGDRISAFIFNGPDPAIHASYR
jgi:hypothetical protein